MKKYKVGILGATGVVGQMMLKVIEEKDLPVELRLLASKRSVGKEFTFNGETLVVEEATETSFEGLDFVLGAVGNDMSKYFAPFIKEAGAVYIDNSSAFRLDPNVPLVVPEVNPEHVYVHQGIIANPNCVTIIGLTAIAPIHRLNPIRRIVASTYQAVSGAGIAGMNELLKQLEDLYLNNEIVPQAFARQIACNLIPQIGSENELGYTSEEMKFQNESRKILNSPDLKVNCTCVRVPVIQSHSISMTLELTREMEVDEVKELLEKAKGVELMEPYPTPLDTTNQDLVKVGRIHKDISADNSIVLWCCGDQVRKGAATNAIQIMELLMN